MALTSANFYNPGFSNFPLSSLTENEDYFQIIWEVMGKNIGTCALMQDDILVALIKVKEKKIWRVFYCWPSEMVPLATNMGGDRDGRAESSYPTSRTAD